MSMHHKQNNIKQRNIYNNNAFCEPVTRAASINNNKQQNSKLKSAKDHY